jgi:hypothetical protein
MKYNATLTAPSEPISLNKHMHSTEFTKPVTTESLLSAFESRFGQTINLEGLDKTQLEDMANMVRTKIHTITDNSHFGRELKDDNYQKHQSMLDILNQAVKESQGVDTNLSPAQQQVVRKIQTVSSLKPQEKDQLIGAMVQKESEVTEGIEQQSELILAAKDMVDKVTGYLEDLASMKTEGMLALADRIRDEMGADKADAFIAKIQPAIESAEATLSQTREDLDSGVRILTGEQTATDTIGADDSMNTDLDNLDTDLGVDDEFGAVDAAAGGTEPEGRAQRESREVFETSSRIYAKLAGK